MSDDQDPTLYELLAVAVARTMRNDDVGFTGLTTGDAAAMFGTMIPLAAMQLARETHAPDLTVLLGGWCVNPSLHMLATLPNAEFDPVLLQLECDARDMSYPPLYTFRRGDVTVGFSSGAQVDRAGNLNTTTVSASRGKLRLVGPILIPEHLGLFGREIIMMPRNDRLRFVESVHHRTGVGFPDGRSGRAALGLRGGGPELVVTPLGIFGFDDEGLAELIATVPGVRPEDVVDATGFDFRYAPIKALQAPPTRDELRILRESVDPFGHLRRSI
ncbi:hypothetical protein [Phytohabitans kaempferiae]|uniref:Uncharacterized protein n=1 Tax=Phytohabitans kaempferiae TaxID=1620943 RepID=A0ABV6M9N1_9ACTN